jgi:hypothetical protein
MFVGHSNPQLKVAVHMVTIRQNALCTDARMKRRFVLYDDSHQKSKIAG